MKKLLVILLALLLLCACGTEDDTQEEISEDTWVYEGVPYDELIKTIGKADVDLSNVSGKLQEILDRGYIIVSTSPDYPPAEFVDAVTGEVKGADILVAQYIANSLGIDFKLETMDFAGVLVALDTGKSDLAISGLGYKEDRAELYELSVGYYYSDTDDHHTIMVPAEDVDKYNSLEDFAGLTIDAQANSLQQMYCEDQLPEDCTINLFVTMDQAILDLQTGKVDAVAFDATTAKNYAESSGGMFVSLYQEKELQFDLSMYGDYAGTVVACKKGETELMDVINQIITQMMAEGKYTDMYYAACDAAGVSPGEE
ncbi:MAG: transporter substrate-binding domain-containing protein [Erysipelotrichaceae bacterium]|nr:transporter substrate-binding domain-containing protein [Erysipelotrichaceae bacterium]